MQFTVDNILMLFPQWHSWDNFWCYFRNMPDSKASCRVIIRLEYECIRGESWKYSMGQKNGLHAFGYNFAESAPIGMKSGRVWAKCWRLALADLGHNPRSSDSFDRQPKLFFFCQVNNTRFHHFPSDKFYDIWRQQRRSEQNFKKILP